MTWIVDTNRYLCFMRNPVETKETILKKSGILFNTRGYKATSISDITTATGFTKGAIYRHFESKDELELESLNYLSLEMFKKVRERIKAEKTAGDKLRSIFQYFESYISNPPVKGGCPLLNAAIESDDAHPVLRRGALKILTILRESVCAILANGVKYKQIKKDVDIEYYAAIIIASLEGAIMMSKLCGNNTDIKRVIKHLNMQVEFIELQIN